MNSPAIYTAENSASQYTKKLKETYATVTQKIVETLEDQGFHVITTMDVKDTIKKKLGINFRNYRILGACNPEWAYKAITLESHLGLTLCCNIVIQEHENGEVEISAVNPMEGMTERMHPECDFIVQEISQRLRKAVDEVH
jgi:uncharacterized protein (DUF302 family)